MNGGNTWQNHPGAITAVAAVADYLPRQWDVALAGTRAIDCIPRGIAETLGRYRVPGTA